MPGSAVVFLKFRRTPGKMGSRSKRSYLVVATRSGYHAWQFNEWTCQLQAAGNIPGYVTLTRQVNDR